MSWGPIARKDVSDSSRSWRFWIFFSLVLVVIGGYALGYVIWIEDSFESFITGFATMLGLFLPLLGILLGYKAVIHERNSGSILLTLSFPHSRKDLVFGKFLGRSIVLLVPTSLALGITGVAGLLVYQASDLIPFPWMVLNTLLYGAVFLSLAIGISLSVTNGRSATLGAFASYLLFVMFWENLVTGFVFILHRFDFSVIDNLPDWALFARLLKPSEAYYRAIRVGYDIEQAGPYLAADAPWYVDWWMAVIILVGWIVVPLALGYYQFSRSDM